MKRNRIFYLSFIVMTAILIGSCSKSSNAPMGGTGGSTSNSVSIANMAFAPLSTTVKVGTTVTWKNNDGVAHTVTSNDGSTFDSGTLAGGASFSYTTTVAGTFAYHCNIHPGMTGTLIVTQ
ncbi:MAG TPA: plastocyanin/azurin family copper-binding protein [Ginsengibacter sp.]|nr:plastocyanin/azurin family copper-binding protein [Ginsengibacter sp.]